MQSLIELYMDWYNEALVGEKGIITAMIESAINKKLGNFLEHDPAGWWAAAPDKEASKRVRKSFGSAQSTKATQKKTPNIFYSERRKRSKTAFELDHLNGFAAFPCFQMCSDDRVGTAVLLAAGMLCLDWIQWTGFNRANQNLEGRRSKGLKARIAFG
jgi:hypothetical protein